VLSTEIPDVLKFLPEADKIQNQAKVYSDFVVTIDLQDAKLQDVEHQVVDGKINIVVSSEQGTILPEQVSFPKPKKKYDLLVVLDAADLAQLGDFYLQNYTIFGEIPSLNIDHHISNKKFASINLVDDKASSTTQIIYELLKQMNVSVTPDIATLLLTGIITDTGSFQNQNTTPEAFDLAAELIEQGARQQEIIKQVYKTKQLNTLKLWGKILSGIQVDEPNRLVWATVTKADFSETGTTEKDTGDIIDDLLANAEEADTVLLLVEKSNGTVYGSLRTVGEAKNASKIAEMFGGGGHQNSAGFTLYNTTIAEVESMVLEKIRAFNAGQPIPSLPVDDLITEPEPNPEDRIDKLAKDFVAKS
jgi:phosphoesterase RecJ-like protein